MRPAQHQSPARAATSAPPTIGPQARSSVECFGSQIEMQRSSSDRGRRSEVPILWPSQAPTGAKANHGSGSKLPLTRGRRRIADRAGLRVSELKAEITVETAMVRANWRKNWPMMPLMNAHGMNTAASTRPMAMTGPDTCSMA